MCGNTTCPIGVCAKCKFPHYGNDMDYPTDDEVTSPDGGCCVYNSSQTNIKEIVTNKGNNNKVNKILIVFCLKILFEYFQYIVSYCLS